MHRMNNSGFVFQKIDKKRNGAMSMHLRLAYAAAGLIASGALNRKQKGEAVHEWATHMKALIKDGSLKKSNRFDGDF